MANKKGISTALKRNLKSGKEYSKLIPPVRCERTNLGSGDTFYTVDAMKTWVEKYAHQTAKLAPVLVGRNLEETVNNIYHFLYSHIQYEADGALQQLRSPACTWVQRSAGVDCKSFSVFASALLSNLGIKHFIRQIRQPYFYPEEFTHVYVVVPENQNDINNSATFVLDATKHQNVESDYIEKVDLTMTKLQHIGLNAPQDERTQRIVENFERFNRFLLEKGVPIETVNAIRERISWFTSKGKDPDFKITPDGLMVHNVLFVLEFKEHVPFLAVQQAFGGPKGLGFTAAFNRGGLGFSFGDAFGDVVFAADKELTDAGVNTSGGIIDAGISMATSFLPLGNILDGILGELNLAANISNVLKYGLSSWGASRTPEEMKKRFAENCYPWLQQELAGITMQNIAEKITAIDVNLRGNQEQFKMLKQNHSRAKSTRLANEWGEQECARLLEKTMTGLNAQLQKEGVSVSVNTVPASASAMSPYRIKSFWNNDDITNKTYTSKMEFKIYKVNSESLSAWMKRQVATISGTVTGAGTNVNAEGSSTEVPQKSGSNTGLILGGIALATAPFFFMKKGAIKEIAGPAKKTFSKKNK